MKAEAFFKQIETRALQHVYYLHGEEIFAKERAIEQLIQTTSPEVRDFNVHRFDHADAEEIIAVCESWPMMDERKIIIVRDERYFGSADSNIQMIVDYLPNICPTACLVFDQNEQADARKTLYKAVNGLKGIVAFERYSIQDASKWAVAKCKQNQVLLPMSLANQLVLRSANQLGELDQNIRKICDYVGENGEVTQETIEALVQPDIEYTVFEMLEHFLKGRIDLGISLLRKTIAQEGTGAIFSMIIFFSNRLRQMLTARIVLERGQSKKEAANAIGGNPYAAKKSVEAAEKFSTDAIEKALLQLADLDYELKIGRVRGEQLLEAILIEMFSSKASIQ